MPSGQESALSTPSWWHRRQLTDSDRTPWVRMCVSRKPAHQKLMLGKYYDLIAFVTKLSSRPEHRIDHRLRIQD
jgi:hypothetical protein